MHTDDYLRLDQIRSDRSLQQEAMKAFLKSNMFEGLPRPEWLLDAQKSCHHWKSPERFFRLLDQWRNNRFGADMHNVETPSDAVGFSRLSKPESGFCDGSKYFGDVRHSNHHAILHQNWQYYDILSNDDAARYRAVTQGVPYLMPSFCVFERLVLRDKRLWQYECRLIKRVTRRRKDLYRKFVHALSQRYDIAIVAPIDAKYLAENAPPEAMESDKSTIHRHAKWAAVSDLVQCVREKFHLRTVEVKSAGITITCAKCGHVNTNNDLRRIQCSGCCKTYSKEENALENMIARGRAALNDGALLAIKKNQQAKEQNAKERLEKMHEAKRKKSAARKLAKC